MDKLRRFICILTPTAACNFRCKYCYLQYCEKSQEHFPKIKVSPEVFRQALSRKRLGGTCMMNLTAVGETLLQPEMVAYARAILAEGHYLEIVTNATVTKAMGNIATFPKEFLSRLMFKCSFHYQELKDRNLLRRFFDNVRMVRDAGASFTIELMPHDELIPIKEQIRKLVIDELGATCHLTVARDASQRSKLPLLSKLSFEEYRKAWSDFDSELFRYKLSVFEKPQSGFCYAGEWMAVLQMGTGDMFKCYRGPKLFNIYDDVTKPLRFEAIGCNCPEPHCFNAHAWLTFGCIPEEAAPYYDEVRNRVCVDGKNWLSPVLLSFFHQKFFENNPKYSALRKCWVNVKGWVWRLPRRNPWVHKTLREVRRAIFGR